MQGLLITCGWMEASGGPGGRHLDMRPSEEGYYSVTEWQTAP